MARLIEFYNLEVDRFDSKFGTLNQKERESKIDGFIDVDKTKISWTFGLKAGVAKQRKLGFEPNCLTSSLYRPFTKQWLYFNRSFNERVYQMPRIFPSQNFKNLVIHTSGVGARSGFSALIADCLPDIQHHDNGQAFPLYLYEESGGTPVNDSDLFASATPTETKGYTRRDAITDPGLAHFQAAYPEKGEGTSITKEALFYYIYGLLHSPDYRSRYADNLGKELPRIPAVKAYADFRAFSQAGRNLAHWHLNYETVACHPGVEQEEPASASAVPEDRHYHVTKMKFAKTKDPVSNKNVNDKTTVIYNEFITLKNIPLAAYDYIVNGKPALEWVMERQSVTTDKDSGITNDANLWATETMQNPKYPLELFLRVVTVSLETMKLVNRLPKLEIPITPTS
jgi:predicted helicase